MANITKIYDIKLQGEKELVKRMQDVNKQFDDAKKRFSELKKIVSAGGLSSGELEKYKVEMQLAKIETEKLRQETIRLNNEGKSTINALRNEREQRRKNKEENKASLTEYQLLSKRLVELRNNAKEVAIIFGIESKEFRAAASEVNKLDKELKAIDSSLGQFQRNVGNYPKEIKIAGISSGVISQLQNSGLGDILGNQVDQTKGKVIQLNSEFARLKAELDQARASGVTDLNDIETGLINNRIEADRLNNEIVEAQNHLSGLGSVGGGVTSGMLGDIKSLILGYVGLQAAMSTVRDISGRAIDFDSVNAAIESVSKETGDYAENKKYLLDLTERLGLKLLDTSQSYKGFFAASTQSGISADKTREIFESASEASAVLKLSQEQTNGVMLAFGQIASKGKVQAEELRGQIGERIPGAFGIAAKAMGVTTKELDKMMSNGELMANDFLPKFAEQLKKTYAAGQEPVKGLRAELNRLDNFISKIANNKGFINTISTTISVVFGLVAMIASIPFGWWIAMVGFLTLAYWSNITAVYASIVAYSEKIIVQTYQNALTAIGNALILAGTILEYAQAVATGVLTAAKWALVLAMNTLGISTASLRAAWLFLNTTFLSTPIGWVILGVIALGAATSAYGQTVDKTSNSLKKQGEQLKLTAAQMRVNAEIERKVADSTSERIAKLKSLTRIVTDLRNSETGRINAMEELISIDSRYSEAMDGNIIKTDKLRQLTDELTESIKKQARAEAARLLLTEKEQKIIQNELKIDELRPEVDKLDTSKNKIGFGQGVKAIIQSAGKGLGIGDGTAADQQTDLILENLKLKEDIELLAGKIATDGYVAPENNNETELPKGEQKIKDYLRDINALREAELSELKKAKLEGSITEEEFLIKSLAVNIKYNNKILDHFKGVDAETRKLRADTASDSIDKRIETNEKLFKIQEDELKQTLENDKAIAQARMDSVLSDPYASDLDKAKAEEEFYSDILNLQVDFNTQMDELENLFNLQSKKNAEDRKNLILKEQSDLNKKRYELSQAQFNTLIQGTKDFEEYRKNNISIESSKKRMAILNDKLLSQEQKQLEIEKINIAESLANVNAELGAVNARIKLYEDERAVQRLTNAELEKYNSLLRQKQLLEEEKATTEQELVIKAVVELELPSAQSLQNKIQSLFSDVNGNFIIGTDANGNGVDGSALLGQAIAQSFDLATQAMNNYFEGERIAVEKSRELAYERIEIEKNQLLARAQSENEKNSIEKQSAEKKKQADKEAGERLKKIKKSEAAVAFATQLSYIAVAAAQNPLNGITLGAAGIAMYATLAAIATAGYLLNVASINKQQFGKGGKYGFGGKLSGPSHSKNNGMPVINPDTGEVQAYMEGDEGIINKRSMNDNSTYTVSGTPNQIASKINSIGGGVDWAGGASLKRFMNGGNYLGSNVQPPVFRSYYENRSGSNNNLNQNNDYEALYDSIAQLRDIVFVESRKKIVLNPNEVDDYQKDRKKQSEIATL